MGDATWGSGTLRLTNGVNNSIPLTIGGNATFTADTTATGTVSYISNGTAGNTILIASTTFYTLNLTSTSTGDNLIFKVATSTSVTVGAGGGTFSSAATFSVASGATLTLNGIITATGATWANSGTVTLGSGGKILNAATVQLTDSSGTAVSNYSADGNGAVFLTVTDQDQNLLPSVEELSATITAVSSISTTQTVTLTETSASSGVFRGGLTFTLSATAITGALSYQGPGTLNYSWTDAQDSADTASCTGCANFTGTSPGGGGSSSGGGTVTVVVATPATPATPAVPTETPAVPATPVVPAAPTLDSVSNKIASVVAKVAALTKTSPAADIAAVQAEITAVLVELQSLQAASSAPQGVALGFNFIRPLALGLRHADVSKLQEALKTDSSVYPEGVVSGYFGPLTLKAVQKFQEKYGIASSGVAGYGNVGPKTRVKLNELFK